MFTAQDALSTTPTVFFPLGVNLTYQLSRFVLSLVDEVFKAFLHGIDELGVLPKANLNDVVQLVLEI